MTSKTIKILLGGLFAQILLYAIFSFTMWDLQWFLYIPSAYAIERVFLVLIWGWATAGVCFLASMDA